MKKDYYINFQEWKIDLEALQKNPSDLQLFETIVLRVENSSEQLKDEIEEHLASEALETDPWMVFEDLSHKLPNKKLMVKSIEDPWFEV